MRVPYYCPYCDQRSTRRWNLNVTIKRRHGGSPGPFLASQPLYNRNIQSDQFGSATIADSIDSFQTVQQAPLGTSQYSASSIYPPTPLVDDLSHGSCLSQETILKIGQLKRLVYKYPQYQNNDPVEVVRLAIYNSINGDNTLLDGKLVR